MTRIAESAEMVEVSCELRRETDRALLIHDGTREIWVPKSQCQWGDDGAPADGKAGTLYVARWMAKREGLI